MWWDSRASGSAFGKCVGVLGPKHARSEAAPGEGPGSGTRVHPPPIVAGAASVPGIRGRGRSVFQATKRRGTRRPARRASIAGRGAPDCVRPGVDDPAERLHPPRGIWILGDEHALPNERTRRRDGPEPGGRIEGAPSRRCDAQNLSWRVRNRSCTVGTTHGSPGIRPVGCTHRSRPIGACRRKGNRDVPRVGRNARGSASSPRK
jgi:hypothetical protein